ncbi:MAG: hypothetical protein IT261_09770 [Saprospiraceae bacterium]|nr:hypothetical protein [Saprospiraceae bacterium]
MWRHRTILRGPYKHRSTFQAGVIALKTAVPDQQVCFFITRIDIYGPTTAFSLKNIIHKTRRFGKALQKGYAV